MLRKKIIHLKTKTRQKLIKANKKINSIIENAGDDTSLLTSEEKEFLSKTKEENKKAKKELNDWLQFIYEHTKELIKSYEQKNDMNIKKLKEIEKKLGNFKKGETLIKDIKTDERGRIILTEEMKNSLHKAQQSLEEGRCLNQEMFRKRFAKWL